MDYSLLVGIKRRNFEVIDSTPTTPLTKTTLDTASAAAPQGPANPLARLQGSKAGASSVAGSTRPVSNQSHSTQNPVEINNAAFMHAYKDPDGAMHAAVVEGQGTFYIGIIDILQEWNYDKWYERMTKKYVLRKDAAGLSAMDPLNYRRRFYQRAVLDVFDGLGLEDADDADIFERYSCPQFLPGENDPLRDTVDTAISSRNNNAATGRNTLGDGSVGSGRSSKHEFLTGGLGATTPTALTRDSDVDASESSSFSHEVQLQSFHSSALSRDVSRDLSRDIARDVSRDSNTLTPTGTDRRFAVKPLSK